MIIDEIDTILNDNFSACMCGSGNCEEAGKIRWDTNDGRFIHLRFDDCVMTTEPLKRCDCIIFFHKVNLKKVIMFIIEVKSRWYKFTDIVEKIRNCLTKILTIIDINKIVIIPVLYARRRISNMKRGFDVFWLGGKKVSLQHLKYKENVTNAIVY